MANVNIPVVESKTREQWWWCPKCTLSEKKPDCFSFQKNYCSSYSHWTQNILRRIKIYQKLKWVWIGWGRPLLQARTAERVLATQRAVYLLWSRMRTVLLSFFSQISGFYLDQMRPIAWGCRSSKQLCEDIVVFCNSVEIWYMYNSSKIKNLKEIFRFLEPLTPLFWTSGDISCLCTCHLHAMDSTDSPLVWHLLRHNCIEIFKTWRKMNSTTCSKYLLFTHQFYNFFLHKFLQRMTMWPS